MNAFIVYMIKSSGCLVIGYLLYQLLFASQSFYARNRALIISIFVTSVLLPLHGFHLSVPMFGPPQQTQTENINLLEGTGYIEDVVVPAKITVPQNNETHINYGNIFFWVYVSISFLLLLYFIIQVLSTIKTISASKFVQKNGKVKMYHNKQVNNTFTFFRSMVINPGDKPEDEINSIIMHESVHAKELHTLDNLFSSLIISIMWFNPFVWLLHKSLKQVHEYAADNYVISNGSEVNNYRSLLLSIITEERLADLSSTFNNSQIKKRFAMMTKKSTQQSKLRILWVIPIFALVFALLAFMNPESKNVENQDSTYNIAIAPEKMNVLFLGVDNPVRIAVAGIPSDEINPEVTNATITKNGEGNYVIRPRRLGDCVVSIYHNDKKIGTKYFRVKRVPNPVAQFAGKSGGAIKKDELLSEKELIVYMQDFNYDLKFKVVEFTVSATIQGFVRVVPTKGNKITEKQYELIKSISTGQRLYFEDIKAVGPDGAIRQLPSLSFIIDKE